MGKTYSTIHIRETNMAKATDTQKIVFIRINLPETCWGKKNKDGYSVMRKNEVTNLWNNMRWMAREIIELNMAKNNMKLVQAEGNTLWFDDKSNLNTAEIRDIVASALGGYNGKNGWDYFNYSPELVYMSHYTEIEKVDDEGQKYIDGFEEPRKITDYINLAD